MGSLLNNEEKHSKKDLAYQAIRQEIRTNKLKPGMKLVERQLCQSLNISRTPIREALQELVNEGLATVIAGEGVVVSEITYEDISETFDLKEVLDGLAAREFANQAKEEEIDKLAAILDVYENDQNEKCFCQCDHEYHRCISEGAKNILLYNTLKNVNEQMERVIYLITHDNEWIRSAHLQHRNIMLAIRQRNPRTAEELMRSHISSCKDYYLRNLRDLRNIMR